MPAATLIRHPRRVKATRPRAQDPELLAVASGIARAAAEALRADRQAARRLRQDLPRDVKIAADEMLQRMIGERLRAQTSWPVRSEEDAKSAWSAEDGFRWIVDPLDGSLNFSRGIPMACISIALWHGERPVLGVIHDVEREEQFTGFVGAGAWLNGVPIQVSSVAACEEAVLCTGFPVGRDFRHPAVMQFMTNVQRYKKIRMLGSAALSLAYVACGRADVYEEESIGLWDIAAGAAIVEAAGGRVDMGRVTAAGRVTILAGNAALLRRAAGRGRTR